tara:strand:+ start:273 stop:548 length:276 start_codon:yes stop_codon:yes gene_type:complete
VWGNLRTTKKGGKQMEDEEWMMIYDTWHCTPVSQLCGSIKWAGLERTLSVAEHLEYWVNSEKVMWNHNLSHTNEKVALLIQTRTIKANYNL